MSEVLYPIEQRAIEEAAAHWNAFSKPGQNWGTNGEVRVDQAQPVLVDVRSDDQLPYPIALSLQMPNFGDPDVVTPPGFPVLPGNNFQNVVFLLEWGIGGVTHKAIVDPDQTVFLQASDVRVTGLINPNPIPPGFPPAADGAAVKASASIRTGENGVGVKYTFNTGDMADGAVVLQPVPSFTKYIMVETSNGVTVIAEILVGVGGGGGSSVLKQISAGGPPSITYPIPAPRDGRFITITNTAGNGAIDNVSVTFFLDV